MALSSSKGAYKTTISSSRNDGRILLNFSDDDMEVYADFFPAAHKGTPLSAAYAKELFVKLNICHGVFWECVNSTIEECNTSGRPQKNILVARGDIPVDGVNEYFRLEDTIKNPPPPHFEEGSQTNYRAFTPYKIVKKDQCLAVKRDAVAGLPGKTVNGEVIPSKNVEYESVVSGKNTHSDEKRIYADTAGQLVITKNVLNVETTLVVRGAVGYATGNINFPGDVILEGQVNDGFNVIVGGSLTVRETLDATEIIVRNDLTVSGGMIGRGRALVKVSGNLKAKFVQNCNVACKKMVNVTTEIINSTFYTMDKLTVGEKGTILGGEIFAFHSVCAGRIGKEHSLPTRIHVGSDWTLRQEIDQNTNLMRMIRAKMEKVLGYLAAAGTDKVKLAKAEDIRKRLENEYRKCEEKKNELEKRYIIDTGAFLVCSGMLAAGTVVDICGIEFVAVETLRKVKLTLDETGNSIIVS